MLIFNPVSINPPICLARASLLNRKNWPCGNLIWTSRLFGGVPKSEHFGASFTGQGLNKRSALMKLISLINLQATTKRQSLFQLWSCRNFTSGKPRFAPVDLGIPTPSSGWHSAASVRSDASSQRPYQPLVGWKLPSMSWLKVGTSSLWFFHLCSLKFWLLDFATNMEKFPRYHTTLFSRHTTRMAVMLLWPARHNMSDACKNLDPFL